MSKLQYYTDIENNFVHSKYLDVIRGIKITIVFNPVMK